jgi:hypothetical protein
MHRIKEKGLYMTSIGTICTGACLDQGYTPLKLVLVVLWISQNLLFHFLLLRNDSCSDDDLHAMTHIL